ncbi:MAG: PIN domain-containing protein [Pseudomonadota bacterium]
MADRFLDTNILVYAYASNDAKRVACRDLIRAGGAVSVQALNEYAAVARRKYRHGWPEIELAVAAFSSALAVHPITAETARYARQLAADTGYSIYDALMLAVALENGASAFLSEDLQHGRVVEGMEIRNPFS